MPWGKDALMQMVEQEEGKSRVLPPGLLRAIADTETRGSWVTDATSPAGAHGLFQFMPKTAKAYDVNSKDPSSSAAGARRMLEDLWKQFDGDVEKVAAAYNWGSGNLSRHGLGKAPKETQDYIGMVKTALSKFGGGDAQASVASATQKPDGSQTMVAAYLPSLGDVKSQAASYSDELMGMIKRVFGQEVTPQPAPAARPEPQLMQTRQEPEPERRSPKQAPTKRSVRQRLADAGNSAEQLLGVVNNIQGMPTLYQDNALGDLNSVNRTEYMAQLAKMLAEFKDSPEGFDLA